MNNYQEWKTYKYKDLISVKTDKLKPKENVGIKCIELEHISQGTGELLGFVEISEQKSIKNKFNKGQVLFGKLRPYLKKYLQPDFCGACSTEIWVMDSINEFLINKYLYYIVQSDQFMKLANDSVGTKMPRADWNFIKGKRVKLPPINEQEKIAEILSTWDESIDIYRNLIEQKRTFLSNLALILVKNKKSLVGFQSKWTKVKLSDVYRERKEYKIPSEEYELYSLTIEDGVTKKTDRYERGFLVKDDKKRYKVTEYNDLVFNPQNLRYGAISLNKTEKPVLLSPIYSMMMIKDESKYDADYFNFLLTSNEMIRYYDSIAEGTLVERMTVKPDVFLNLEFNIPPFEEQLKISKILLAFKNEINVLNEAKELLEKQKQGLMQQLLTGKIRVNLN